MQIQAVEEATAPDTGEAGFRAAKGKSQILLTGETGAPNNYLLRFSSGQEGENWTTPRHRHAFDQIRYVLEGNYSIGTDRYLPQGWVGYFPESVHYGPQEMSPNLRMLLLQFGGPSGLGFYSTDQRRDAMQALRDEGREFGDGYCTWIDENGVEQRQPAGDAMWEKIHGAPLEYPAPRYGGLLLMDPQTFDWQRDPAAPGVSRRRLGTFTERGIGIDFVRVAKGGVLHCGVPGAPVVLLLTAGRLRHADRTIEGLTVMGTEPGEVAELWAIEDAELFEVTLPTFAD